jgi:hypothetical protein
LPIHVHKDVIKKDLEELVGSGKDIWTVERGLRPAGHHTNVKLADYMCSLKKGSKFTIIGTCLCGMDVLFRLTAVWQNGKIVEIHSDHDNHDCPECLKKHGVKREVRTYKGIHGRVG